MPRIDNLKAATLLLTLALLFAAPLVARAGPTLVFDVESGSVLHAEDAGASWYPASLTKLMTAYVTFHAMREGRLTPDSTLTMSELARAEPPSKVGLPVGAEFTVDWALQVLIVRSANDIAVALAEGVAGSEAQFVALMNEAARRLSMTGTYFSNPHGLPDRRQMTTARDMGLLARAIIREFPEYQAYFEAPSVRIGGRNLRNRNGLLRTMEGADGMKTGFICNSGYNLVASATRNGRRLVAVIFGSPNGGQRTQTAKALLEQGFAEQPSTGLLTVTRSVDELPNGTGIFATSQPPVDMAPTVCRGQGTVRLTQPEIVRGWSVILGSADGASDAQDMLDQRLEPLRQVFYGGRAVVVKAPDSGRYMAMVHNLGPGQTTTICAQVIATNGTCEVLPPDAYRDVIARLEEEERAAEEARRQERREQQAAAAAAAAAEAAAAQARNQASQSSSGTQAAAQPPTQPQTNRSDEVTTNMNAGASSQPGSNLTMEDLR